MTILSEAPTEEIPVTRTLEIPVVVSTPATHRKNKPIALMAATVSTVALFAGFSITKAVIEQSGSSVVAPPSPAPLAPAVLPSPSSAATRESTPRIAAVPTKAPAKDTGSPTDIPDPVVNTPAPSDTAHGRPVSDPITDAPLPTDVPIHQPSDSPSVSEPPTEKSHPGPTDHPGKPTDSSSPSSSSEVPVNGQQPSSSGPSAGNTDSGSPSPSSVQSGQ